MAMKSLGYYQSTDVAAKKSLAEIAGGTIPDGANGALVQAEDQDCRWRDDTTDPTASVGVLLAAGASIFVDGNLSAFEIVETTASAKVNVVFYKT